MRSTSSSAACTRCCSTQLYGVVPVSSLNRRANDSFARMAVRYEKRDDLGPIEMREHLVSRP